MLGRIHRAGTGLSFNPMNNKMWINAHRLKNYTALYNAVCAVAGEGEQVTPEQVGKTPLDFAYDEVRLVILKGSEILYSLNRADGAIDVDYLGEWHPQPAAQPSTATEGSL